MHIILLLCDSFSNLPPSAGSYANLFKGLFHIVGTQNDELVTFAEYHVYLDSFPILEKDSVYFISGSNHSAYEESTVEWISRLCNFIREGFRIGSRFIGFCFGHQLICQALGGEVKQSPKGWGLGLRSSTVLNPLLRDQFFPSSLLVLCNHHDQVTAIPQMAELYVTNPFCPNEGIRIGSQIMTMQSHPEYTKEYLKAIIENEFPNESESVKKEALASMEQYEPMSQQIAKMILDVISGKIRFQTPSDEETPIPSPVSRELQTLECTKVSANLQETTNPSEIIISQEMTPNASPTDDVAQKRQAFTVEMPVFNFVSK